MRTFEESEMAAEVDYGLGRIGMCTHIYLAYFTHIPVYACYSHTRAQYLHAKKKNRESNIQTARQADRNVELFSTSRTNKNTLLSSQRYASIS